MVFSYQHRGQTSGFPGRSVVFFATPGPSTKRDARTSRLSRGGLESTPSPSSGWSEVSITAAFDEEGVWFAWGEGDRVDRDEFREATTRSGGGLAGAGRAVYRSIVVYRGLSV